MVFTVMATLARMKQERIAHLVTKREGAGRDFGGRRSTFTDFQIRNALLQLIEAGEPATFYWRVRERPRSPPEMDLSCLYEEPKGDDAHAISIQVVGTIAPTLRSSSTGTSRSFVRTARRLPLTLPDLVVSTVPRGTVETTVLEKPMTSTRIAFLDIDGTILDHGKAIAPSTVAAVRGARAAGHLVYLCTGRAAGAIPPEVSSIGFDGAVTNGGAYATSGDEAVVAAPMPREAVQRLMAYFEGSGILFFLQTDDAVHASPQVQDQFDAMMRRWEITHGEPDEPQTAPQEAPRARDLTEVDLDCVAKAVFLGEAVDTVARAQNELGDRFHIVPGSMPLPGGSNGEIGMRGTTKGSAIESVLDHLGIDRSAAIGIGDSWNDVEMFEVCGRGIAMGNAAPELKALADESTTSVREDGVWNAFVRHGLIVG